MKWYGYVIIALMGFLLYTVWHYQSTVDKMNADNIEADSSAFKDMREVMVLKAQAQDRAKQDIRELMDENQRVQDSAAEVMSKVLVEMKRLRGLIKPVSVVMTSDTAEIRAQLTYRDQAIDNCDSSLLVRSGELTQARAFCDTLQSIEARKDKVQETAINALNSAAWDNADRAQRLQNKLDNPWSFGLHAGYGATLSGGQVYMGPQAGASVQYKIILRKRR